MRRDGWVGFGSRFEAWLPLLIGVGLMPALGAMGRFWWVSMQQRVTGLDAAASMLWVVLSLGLLGGVVLVGVGYAGVVAWRERGQSTLAISLWGVGWWPVLVSGAVMSFLEAQGYAGQAATWVVPMALGVQAAFLFVPADEPLLEVSLAWPRSVVWTVVERFGALLICYGAMTLLIGGVGIAVGWASGIEAPVALWQWLAPTLFVGGLALWLSQVSREAAFGLLGVVGVWGTAMVMEVRLLEMWPFLWPLALFLQPDDPLAGQFYGCNRLFLGLVGVAFVMLATGYMRDEGYILQGQWEWLGEESRTAHQAHRPSALD